MSRVEPPVSEAFSVLADVALAQGIDNVRDHDDPVRIPISDQWCAWINGQSEPRHVRDEDGQMAADLELPPYHACVTRNGWLVALLYPYGGQLINCTEDDLIAALREALKDGPE